MRKSQVAAIFLIGGAVVFRAAPLSASPCAGDCSIDAVTGVDELVTCVNIGLGLSELDACTSCDQGHDGSISIDDLVNAVGRAVAGCESSFSEAASGIVGSSTDAAKSYTVMDFGYIGNSGAFRTDGGGAGAAPCIGCPGGGVLAQYDCVTAGGTSRMTALLEGCRNGTATRTGKLELLVNDPEFCRTCEIVSDVSGTQTLSEYIEIGADGTVIEIPDELREEFSITPGGCLGTNRLDKTSNADGTIRVIGPQTNATFVLTRLLRRIESGPIGRQDCQVTTRQSGSVQIEDSVHDRRFLQTSRDFLRTEISREDGTRFVTIDTPRGGSFEIDCLGGEAQIATLEPLVYAPGAECASAGLMQLAFAGGTRLAHIRATEGGGLAFDFDSDGAFDREISDCNDPSLSQCTVDLPDLRTPLEPAPEGKIIVANDERPLTNLGFTTAADTERFVANLAEWFTEGNSGAFHAYSTNLGLIQSMLAEVMVENGHTWTTGTDLPFDLPALVAFDGIFSALEAPGLDPDVLTTYVRGGGNVYIAAGTSQNAAGTAALWRPFLERFGLDLEERIGIGAGIVAIASPHPIFAGVESMYHDGGQGVLATDPRAEIIACVDGIGLFGAYPATLDADQCD